MEYHLPKGVFDLLPFEPDPNHQWRCIHLWQFVENQARKLCHLYGFGEIRTPIFEYTELFKRSVGAETDIVAKEMYTFEDKAGRSLSLRPEGTAPVMRAFLDKHLEQVRAVHKFFYLCPIFRYERQQAGRYRQHHQFGVEAIGNDSALQDVEGIDLLFSFLQRLGIKGLTLHLNSIGNLETRTRYIAALKKYLAPHLTELSEDSQRRFEHNPLRILDSKDVNDKKILSNAPSIVEFLDEESSHHFQEVCTHLELLGIAFKLEPKLVRGLDYYNKTVFEITAEEIGAQNSLGGGGRFDGLLASLKGPDLPAFGFGAGLERIIQTMLAQKVAPQKKPGVDLYLIPLGDKAVEHCFMLLQKLRAKEIATEMDFSGKKLKAALRMADQIQASYVAVVGEEELATQHFELKEMQTGHTCKLSFEDLFKEQIINKLSARKQDV